MVWVIFSLKPTNRYTYTCNTKMRNIYVPRQAYRILVLVDVSYVNSILKILYNIYTRHNTIIIIYTIYKQWMELMYNLLITYSKILVSDDFHRIHSLGCNHICLFGLYIACQSYWLKSVQRIIKTFICVWQSRA